MFEAWDRDPGHREAVSPESVRRFVLPIRWDFFAKFGGAGGGGGGALRPHLSHARGPAINAPPRFSALEIQPH